MADFNVKFFNKIMVNAFKQKALAICKVHEKSALLSQKANFHALLHNFVKSCTAKQQFIFQDVCELKQ